jgi:glycosyltransferase involved in cell wall biosynthesis
MLCVADRPLKIAMLGPIAWRTPPRAYGPWELVTSLLTEALVARGHDVTLFATCDSFTAGTLAAVVPAPYSEDPTIDAKVWEMRHVAHAMERVSLGGDGGDFDIVHNQADFVPLGFARLIATPMVMTLHARPSERILPMLAEYQNDVGYVAIGESDRHPDLRYVATIPHGIDVASFPFVAEGGEDLLFFGRMHPDKGPADAIRAAARAGRRLRMAGVMQDQGYFDRQVAPHIDGERVIYQGAIGGQARVDALGRARAMLHLIGFDEPFGLSVVEAMACGTPVIAYRRGSMETLIDHGRTGFVVDTLDEAVEAIAQAHTIDRAACREAVRTRFSIDAMAEAYVALYRRVLDRGVSAPW